MANPLDDLVAGRGIKGLYLHEDNSSATATSLSNSDTVSHRDRNAMLRLNNGGAVTGIILEKGARHGQMLTLVNTTANSVTFAADATSNVFDGTNIAIAAKRACILVWDAVASLWVAVKSA